MAGMLTLRADKCVRLATGCGLFLLLAAQERVCPWVGQAPPAPPSEAAPKGVAPDQPDGQRKRPARRLPLLLPDTLAPAPRWSAATNQMVFRVTIGWHDGVVTRGPQKPPASPTATDEGLAADRWWWHRFLELDDTGVLLCEEQSAGPASNPAIGTVIARTGPPTA